MADLSEQIETLAQAPASVSAGGTTVTEPNLKDVVEADKHLAEKQAVSAPNAGLRLFHIKFGGAV